MSRFVPTSIGLFRKDDEAPEFLFLCPTCDQWLPMGEERLAGREAVDHGECSYKGAREYGKWLVSTMQARRLMAAEGEGIRTYETSESLSRHETLKMRNPALYA